MSYLEDRRFQFWVFFAIAFMGALWLFQSVLSPFVVGFAVAYLLNPIVSKLDTRYKIPRWLSSLVILGMFFLLIVIGLIAAIPVLAHEMTNFIKLIPVAFAYAQDWVARTFPMIDLPQSLEDVKNIDSSALTDNAAPALAIGKGIFSNIFKSGMAVIGFVSFLVLMPIVAFYLLIDWARLGQKISELMPKKKAGRIRTILSEIDTSLSGFIRGQLIVCMILGGFYAIALSLLGLPYGFFVGVASGILSIIPYVGSTFGLVASVGLAFYQFGGWEYPLAAFIIFAIGQLVEGNYLTPKLVGDSVGLHPLWIIFALMAGGMILGLLGMMIAVPVAAVIAVLIRHGIDMYKSSPYYKK